MRKKTEKIIKIIRQKDNVEVAETVKRSFKNVAVILKMDINVHGRKWKV